MVVVTLAAVETIPTDAPLVLVWPDRLNVKSSGPSSSVSSTRPRSTFNGTITSPSLVAVKVIVPVAALNATVPGPTYAVTAVCTAVR